MTSSRDVKLPRNPGWQRDKRLWTEAAVKNATELAALLETAQVKGLVADLARLNISRRRRALKKLQELLGERAQFETETLRSERPVASWCFPVFDTGAGARMQILRLAGGRATSEVYSLRAMPHALDRFFQFAVKPDLTRALVEGHFAIRLGGAYRHPDKSELIIPAGPTEDDGAFCGEVLTTQTREYILLRTYYESDISFNPRERVILPPRLLASEPALSLRYRKAGLEQNGKTKAVITLM